MTILFRLFLISFICLSCSEETVIAPPTMPVSKSEVSVTKTNQYTLSVFQTDSSNAQSGFGYNIIVDGTIFIHQPTIPSVQGTQAFHSKEQAEAVAHLMIYKLEHNIMPPSVSKHELDSLHILN